MSSLALFGGHPVRTKAFQSRPCIDENDINIVIELMRKGRFSQFIGSPTEGTRELLKQKSKNLASKNSDVSFLGGEYVRKFEASWSETLGVDYSISVNSATSGLTTALIALGVGPGCEVITTPLSFTATAASIVAANAIPIFCDIDKETFCISPEAIEKSISKSTKAIIYVHWCGNAGDFDQIVSIANKHNLILIEDAAQAPATVYKNKYLGTWGNVGIFSFNESKNIMTGEGGMIVTNNPKVAEKCRLVRNHGESIPVDEDPDDYVINTIGYNFRLTEIQAAIGFEQIKKLPKLNGIRSENYQYLSRKLTENFGDLILPQRITHPDSYFAYTAAFRWLSNSGISRIAFATALRAEGIPVVTQNPRLLCDHPMFKRKLAFGGHYPWNTLNNAIEIDSLPDFPNARLVHDQEYLAFFQVGFPNNITDMDDIIIAFKKILKNKNDLINFQKKWNP